MRAGFTPKFKDVGTLCEMLTYQSGPVHVLRGKQQASPLSDLMSCCPVHVLQGKPQASLFARSMCCGPVRAFCRPVHVLRDKPAGS